jgi:hypothetical protein
VNPADALFDLHGIPGQVVVDHLVAELQIASLTADFGGHQNILCFPEITDLLVFDRVGHATMEHRMGYFFPTQKIRMCSKVPMYLTKTIFLPGAERMSLSRICFYGVSAMERERLRIAWICSS